MLLKAPRQWVASPFGYNVLLALLNEDTPAVDRYREITQKIKKKHGYTMWNKLFVSSKKSSKSIGLQNWTEINVDAEKTDFTQESNPFLSWVQKFGQKGHVLELATKSDFVLANAMIFECTWKKSGKAGASMKIINTFSYTSDILYDARILELPLTYGYQLIIIIPSETDMLDTLFSRLTKEGLASAIKSLNPVFTVNSNMVVPSVNVTSTIYISNDITSIQSGSAMQCGTITVNEKGTFAKVLTYIMSVNSEPLITDCDFKSSDTQFRFAIVSHDTPLLTGQFVK